MKTSFRYAVIGCGVIGASAVYWLARAAGDEVIGFERFPLGHDNGASRTTLASSASPTTLRNTPRSPRTPTTAWGEVEEEIGVQLVVRCGGLDLAPATEPQLVDHYAAAMSGAGIPFDDWTGAESHAALPAIPARPGRPRALPGSRAGCVDPRKAIHTQVALARAHGATVLDNTPVRAHSGRRRRSGS